MVLIVAERHFTPMRGKLAMHDRLVDRYKEDVRRIARSHGATKIRVFGSHAAGGATPFSDLDLLVDLEDGRDLLDLVGLKQDLESLLECSVDVLTEGCLSPYLRERILQEARAL
jgi:predicted nucleotidyltransferase